MAKPRRKARTETQIKSSLMAEMRGLIQATRARSALRSLTPTQAKVRINELWKETLHEYKNPQRQVLEGQVSRTQVSGRSKKLDVQLHGKRVPSSVRDLFQSAQRALVCTSRDTRREIMFAMRRTGKAGARRNRKARWNSSSFISCKKG